MSLYDYWKEFISLILGNSAPEILYTASFILFIILFFAVFLKIFKMIMKGIS